MTSTRRPSAPAEAVPEPRPAPVGERPAENPPPAEEAVEGPTDQPIPQHVEEPIESPLRSAVSAIATVGPPLTIVTALMIYFGWARSNTQAHLMGIDVSLFGFTTQDYVLQSISTLFVPLLVLGGVGLAALAVHRRLSWALRDPEARPRLRWAGHIALAVGLVVAAACLVIAAVSSTRDSLVLPLVLGAAVAVAGYGAWLADAAGPRGPAGRASYPPGQRALRTFLVTAVVTLALLWELSSYSGVVGRGYAQQLEQNVSQLPRATAFSAEPLGIEAPGVREERVVEPSASGRKVVRYRTTGLRFLVRSGDRLFLLHDGWRIDGGVVVVLPDTDAIRWQFSR
jgi:hypothetical protein